MKLAMGVVAAMLLGGAAQAQTMTTGWGDIQMDAATCVQGARQALEQLGYSGITSGRESAFGWRNSYGVAVRCIAEHNVVIYFIYGENQASNEQLGNQLRPMLMRGPGRGGAAPGK